MTFEGVVVEVSSTPSFVSVTRTRNMFDEGADFRAERSDAPKANDAHPEMSASTSGATYLGVTCRARPTVVRRGAEPLSTSDLDVPLSEVELVSGCVVDRRDAVRTERHKMSVEEDSALHPPVDR